MAKLWLLVMLAVCIMVLVDAQITHYQFTRYPYKKKPKNERRIKHVKSACEQSDDCQARTGLDQVVCIRECMSEKCYTELYSHDPLEEGEIDVRYNSFKGCVLQGLPRN